MSEATVTDAVIQRFAAHFMFQKGAIEMEVSGLMSGGYPLIKKYQINATVANAGVPLLVGAAGEAGLDLPTTTGAQDMVGLNLDTATYSTTQGSGASSAERLVSVIINPDAILRSRMSGGAAEGTALSLYDVTTASAGGTAITTGDEWSSPTFDEGVVWGYDGANVGQSRKLTSVSSTAGTVTVRGLASLTVQFSATSLNSTL